MGIVRVVLSLGALLVPVCAAATDPQKTKQADDPALRLLPPGSRIAVIASRSTGGSQVDRVVGDMLTTALRRSGLRIVERIQLDDVVKEQRLAADGIVDPQHAVRAGKALGADYLLTARATEFGVKDDRIGALGGVGPFGGIQIRTSTARVVLDVSLIDSTTGSVLTTDTAEGKQVDHGGTLVGGRISGRSIDLGGIDIGSKDWSESTLGKAARKAVGVLTKHLVGSGMPAQGWVLAVTPVGEVIVDVGGLDGIRVGDRLAVMRIEHVNDSKGVPVWSEEKEIGEIRVTDIRVDRAKAVPVEKDCTVAEGDLVRMRAERGT